jgi:hypothetical protein
MGGVVDRGDCQHSIYPGGVCHRHSAVVVQRVNKPWHSQVMTVDYTLFIFWTLWKLAGQQQQKSVRLISWLSLSIPRNSCNWHDGWVFCRTVQLPSFSSVLARLVSFPRHLQSSSAYTTHPRKSNLLNNAIGCYLYSVMLCVCVLLIFTYYFRL